MPVNSRNNIVEAIVSRHLCHAKKVSLAGAGAYENGFVSGH